MPYAIKETGLVAGLILIFVVAMLADKSLRMLIDCGKHVRVQSYETLFEAAFGRSGFVFISLNMFFMSFGAMVAYLQVVKDTLPIVFGVDHDDDMRKRAILLISSLVVILPLSMQRDMADLAKTSAISVVFNLCMVFIIAISAPVRDSVREHGGMEQILEQSIVNPSTLFVGLGVFSFAFVCQDSSFIIAGSLQRPTRERWGMVTRSSLLSCATLATILGLAGYLAFQGDTEGNILNNFKDIAPDEMVFDIIPRQFAVDVARGLIGLTMFCVYPLASYIARHVLIVLLFSGRQAHEGDDHTVLARRDRRIVLTLALYIAAIVPAMIFDDTGVVFSVTGAVAGSSLSYLGPGAVFLGIHGKTFLAFAKWNVSTTAQGIMWKYPVKDRKTLGSVAEQEGNLSIIGQFFRIFLWWLLLMPLWCSFASAGMENVKHFEEEQLRKSPAVQHRLGMINHRSTSEAIAIQAGGPAVGEIPDARFLKTKSSSFDDRKSSDHMTEMTERYPLLKKPMLISPSGETSELIRASEGHAAAAYKSNDEYPMENDPQDNPPSLFDFILAISYIVLGAIALTAGLWSVSTS